MLKLFIPLAIVLGAVFALKIILEKKSKQRLEEEVIEKEERYPYIKRNYLMTNREREFFFTLKEKYGNEYYIVPQVPLSKIVDVNHYEKHQWG